MSRHRHHDRGTGRDGIPFPLLRAVAAITREALVVGQCAITDPSVMAREGGPATTLASSGGGRRRGYPAFAGYDEETDPLPNPYILRVGA
jgi:hypothetical protein